MKKSMPYSLFWAALVLLLMLAACGGDEATPTAEPAPTEPPAATATAVPEATDLPAEETAWDHIQAAGQIVVGTAADYPPFEFYNENFRLDGYDIALMTDIGSVLGLDVEFVDMGFDGLDEALALGQIDVAISALSVTPERAHHVAFSNIYYVGQDALLASDASTLAIRSTDQLADLRVGVQSRSVYEDFVREQLVEPGLMPEENLLAYGTSNQGLADLETGRVDVVMVDLLPAELAVESRDDLKIVGQGLNQQRFAIAVPLNEAELLGQINDALLTLQNQGRVAELAQQFLNLSNLPPLEPPPVVTPVPPEQSCIDGMAFVRDLNLDDNNMQNPPVMSPGQTFQKGWRVRNIGTCTWNSSYSLAYVTGNVPSAQMGATRAFVRGEVAPGETYDFFVTLQAPRFPGTYQAFWEMRNGEDQAFGQRVWVGITVPGAPTPIPVPTQTPAPDITFTVDRNPINEGECATFSWNVQNIQAVWFYPSGQDFNRFPTTGQNSSRQCPPSTTTYNLRVQRLDGAIEIRQITLVIEPTGGPPRITQFSAQPATVQIGQCVAVSWRVEGSVNRVLLTRNGVTLWDGAPVSGQLQDCPQEEGFAAYVIEASGGGGTSRLQTNVSVFR